MMRAGVALVLTFAVVGLGACSLNPQPLPPGSDDTARDRNDASVNGGGSPPATSDAGAGNAMDASFGLDAGAPPLGDAGGTSDAETDAPSDAPSDAPPDAPSDANDSG